jgi:hypothetical protein
MATHKILPSQQLAGLTFLAILETMVNVVLRATYLDGINAAVDTVTIT